MKNLIRLTAIIAVLFSIISCSKKDEGNGLDGTIWTRTDNTIASKEPVTYYIEFSSGNVKIWDTYYYTKGATGTYKTDGNTITIKNAKATNIAGSVEYTHATYTDNSLTLYYKYDGFDSEVSSIYVKK